MKKRTLPDYLAYQKTTVGNAIKIVAYNEPIDYTINTEDVDTICLYQDTITIDKNIEHLGKNYTINARKIIAKNSPTIFVSGKEPDSKTDFKPGDRPAPGANGANGSEDGANGQHGNPPIVNALSGGNGFNAGNLNVSAQILVVEPEDSKLTLNANGGRGGRGQDGGNGGNGGNGSKGANAIIQKGLQTDHIKAQGQKGGNGGDGGKGGKAGISGNGGNGGQISVSLLVGKDCYTETHGAGEKGPDAAGGNGGKKGTGGGGGENASCHSSYCAGTVITVCDLNNKYAGTGSLGSEGPNGDISPNAINGQLGTHVDYSGAAALNQIICTSSFYQRQLTLHHAQEQYRSNQFDEAQQSLNWLKEIAPDFSMTPEHDALGALKDSNSDVSVDEWTWLHKRVTNLDSQLQQGLNFQGYPSYNLEIETLPNIIQGIDSLLKLTQSCETAFNDYLSNVGDTANQQKAFQASLTAYQSLLTVLKSQIQTDLKDQLEAAKKSMDTLAGSILNQKAILQSFDSSFSTAVTSYTGCSLEDTLTALNCIVSLDDWAQEEINGIAKLVGNLKAEGLTFPNSIQDVIIGGSTFSELQTAWKEVVTEITKENPDSAKIVLKSSDLKNIVDGFYTSFSTCSEDQKQAVTCFIELVQAYNQRILTWNAINIKTDFLNIEVEARQKELDRVTNQFSASNDCTGSPMRNLVMNLYYGALDLCEEWLNREYRAYAYSTGMMSTFDIQSESVVDLIVLHEKMQSEINRKNTQLNSDDRGTNFSDIAVELKASDNPQAFKELLKTGIVTLTVDSNSKGFSDVARTRVSEVSVEISGAKTSSGKLNFTLHHSGQSMQEDVDNKALTQNHNIISTQGIIDTSKGKVMLMLPVVMTQMLSPFTSWILEIPESSNSGLQLDGVTSIKLSFNGVGISIAKVKAIKVSGDQ